MADAAPKTYSNDPTLYLYTSLTSGSSHIVTATSRLETILKANQVPFKAIDIATDEKARMLWGRRSGKDESGRVRKLPGLVQMGLVVGDLVEIEDWNEYGELKLHVTIVKDPNAPAPVPSKLTGGAPAKAPVVAPVATPVVAQENKKIEPVIVPEIKKEAEDKPVVAQPSPMTLALRQIGEEAAHKAKDLKKKGMETFSGVGKAVPAKEQDSTKLPKEKTIAIPGPLNLVDKTNDRDIDLRSSLQSPASSSWTVAPNSAAPLSPQSHSIDALASLQSPNSTAWRSTSVAAPNLHPRGLSTVPISQSEASKIEKAQAIKEEEDDDEEEEDDDDTDDESSDEEEDDESPSKNASAQPKVLASKKVEDEGTSESSDSSDEESEVEESPKAVSTKPSGVAAKIQMEETGHETSDSSESSDEEARAPAPKSASTTAKAA